MIEEFRCGGYTVRCYGSIRQLPAPLWDTKIAQNHPYKTAAFMRKLEICFPDRDVVYLAVYENDDMVGLTLATFEYFDPTLGFRPWALKLVTAMRRIWNRLLAVPMAMVGTYETAQEHWWFDAGRINANQFAKILLEAIGRHLPKPTITIVRDFVDSKDQCFRDALVTRRFRAVDNHPMAAIHLNGLTSKAHYARLRARARHTLRKLDATPANKVEITNHDCFEGILDECYQLYLNVHNKAEDFQRPALPKVFLEMIGELPETRISVLRMPTGEIGAFLMTGFSETISAPSIIGMDYQQSREFMLYHHGLWQSVEEAAKHGCREIDLGLTGYFVKQSLGAELHTLTICLRLENSWLDRLLGARLARALSAPPPEKRRLFRESQ
ncbi:MAG: GNAT family N-acetyltransferase [Xanthomonadaceae bacterium]|nr:GNAT family N-acetyltransferase [Xanthomonadaceae bacterium]